MDKSTRDKAIVKERNARKTTFSVLGDKYGITPSRAHQIYQRNSQEFYSRLPEQSKRSNRIRRLVLTKEQIAEKFQIPANRLELRV